MFEEVERTRRRANTLFDISWKGYELKMMEEIILKEKEKMCLVPDWLRLFRDWSEIMSVQEKSEST